MLPRFIHPRGNRFALAVCAAAALAFCAAPSSAQITAGPFLPGFRVVSTIPANGDVNPYGVAFVPQGVNTGMLHAGDILVSNFNNKANLQGTGTTIIRVPAAGGPPTLFFQGKTGLGLSTALHVTKTGNVIVGNFPSTDGTCGTATPGSILFLNSNGVLLLSISGNYIDGPWDSALIDQGNSAYLFVANALNGTIERLFLEAANGKYVQSAVTIGSGFMHQCDPVTFVDAPTGLVYNPKTDQLYVASTLDNKIFALHDATTTTTDEGTGSLLVQDDAHLHGALAMVMAPNGDLLVSNNDVINPNPNQPSAIDEYTSNGQFVKQINVDPAPGGSFGLNAQMAAGGASTFAAVDDNASTLLIFTLPPTAVPSAVK